MPKINYVVGDATKPQAAGPKVITHIVNSKGGWGRGFVVSLSKVWSSPEQRYREWFKAPRAQDPPFILGEVQFVKVSEDVWVANLLGQDGYLTDPSKPPVRYKAIENGLNLIGSFSQLHRASVHMPRIGCGLAGGTWESIEPLLKNTLLSKNIAVYVYDLPNISNSTDGQMLF